MKFDNGFSFGQSARRDSRGRTADEQDDLEAQLRAAQDLATNNQVDASNVVTDFELGDRTGVTPADVTATPGAAPSGNTRAEDQLDPSRETDHADLENAALGRALELMTQGQVDLEATRENIRNQSQEAIAQTVGDANARAAGGGFGASGIQQNIEGTIRSQGSIAENEAILAAERDARDENLRNILAGNSISQGERGLQAELDDRGMRNQLIADILRGDDPAPAGDNRADLNDDGYVNAGEGINEILNQLYRFFGEDAGAAERRNDLISGNTVTANG